MKTLATGVLDSEELDTFGPSLNEGITRGSSDWLCNVVFQKPRHGLQTVPGMMKSKPKWNFHSISMQGIPDTSGWQIDLAQVDSTHASQLAQGA